MKVRNSILQMTALLFIVLGMVACNSNKSLENSTSNVESRANTGNRSQMRPPQNNEQEEALYAKLQLTEDQETQLKAVREKYRKEAEAKMSSSGGDRRAMRENMKGIRDREMAEVKTILSDSQYSLYEEEMEKMKPKGGPGGRGQRPNRG